ncbi:MAG: tRNA pseudouridine(38-40) synthase TruA [Bryobacteraceae bacterium]
MGVRRLRFQAAYDGTEFHGWQIQPGLPTIQGILEEVISGIEGRHVDVVGSGRTDAGVHALGQVAAVSLANSIPADNFRRAVNRLLPKAIRISSVCEVNAEFHPRFDAKRKLYRYRIFREEVCPPFERHYVTHHPYPLDEAAMAEAAPLLEGEHDFTAFAASDPSDSPERSRVRRVFSSVLKREGAMLMYEVRGSGFLKHMVRNIVGVLLEVGKGNLDRNDVLARLQSPRDFRSGPSAPPSGLFLVSVDYDAPV